MRLANFFAIFVSLCCSSISMAQQAGSGWWMWNPVDSVGTSSSQSLFSSGYRPDQPIAFSHSLHAGDLKMDCQYCHNAARKSTSAGIPPLNTCMGCHKIIKKDSPEIQKIHKAYNNNEPMIWNKVHDSADYVRFSHQIHVNAKDKFGMNLLACEDCHGNVKGMTVAEQYAPLKMGWCIECHNRVKIPAKDGKPPVTNASVSCNTCHY